MMSVVSGEALQVAFSKRAEARINTDHCLSLVTCHVINVSSLYQAGNRCAIRFDIKGLAFISAVA